MLIGASLLVSIPPSLRPMLFPRHCVFLALTFLYLLSHPQTLNLTAVVVQHSLSPLSLCLLLRSFLPLFLSFCLVWWMESLDCEQHILGGAWQAIAGCLIRASVWAFLCCFRSLRLLVVSQIESRIHQNLAQKWGRQPSPEVSLATINAKAAATWPRYASVPPQPPFYLHPSGRRLGPR